MATVFRTPRGLAGLGYEGGLEHSRPRCDAQDADGDQEQAARLLVLFTALRSSVSILEVPFVAWLGKISYSIYLTHYFIREPFEQVLYFKVPRKGYFQTGIWTGDLLAAFFVLLVLAVSHFTFR